MPTIYHIPLLHKKHKLLVQKVFGLMFAVPMNLNKVIYPMPLTYRTIKSHNKLHKLNLTKMHLSIFIAAAVAVQKLHCKNSKN